MALPIRQGATHKVVIGPVVAVGDGFTPVTTLALSTADEAEVILHDNATVVDISAYTFAAIATADGYYHLTLQSGISNTVGHMTVVINDDSLCLPVKADFVVLDTAAYDAIYKDAAVMDVNVITVAGTAQTAGDIPALVTTVDTVVDGIQTDLSNATDGLGAIKTDTAAILVDTGSLNDTKIPDTISLANINSEVVDTLNTDTYAEPGQGAPGATISLAAKIGYLYKAWRNRSNQTATTYQLFNDDATTVDHKATVSDDATTAEKGEVATGP